MKMILELIIRTIQIGCIGAVIGFGLPDGTVKSYMFKARKLLKHKLAKPLKAL
jgi:hypothetical protein